MAYEPDNGARGPRASVAMPVRRVRKAYEQVADQIRELIMTGEIAAADRLPSEAALAAQFGVSRASVREALRVLSAQSLIRTSKGATGGSYVTMPSVDHISAFLGSNINLLSLSEEVTLDEFLEAREFFEVPAARMAARRRTPELIDTLRAAIPSEPLVLSTDDQFVHNRDFHQAVVDGSGNTLLSIAAQPVFTVLQTRLRRSVLPRRFSARVVSDHQAILAALESGDEEASAREMHDHLAYLRPVYEKAWRKTRP